jgi:hypothetical protein
MEEGKEILLFNNQGEVVDKAICSNDHFDAIIIDHVNNNPFDNRKSNLRTTTIKGNAENTSKRTNATSNYYGVMKYQNKWLLRSDEISEQMDCFVETQQENFV